MEEILPKETIAEVYKDIHAAPVYRKLFEKYQNSRNQGNFAQAMIFAKKMKDFEVEVFTEIAKKCVDRRKLTASLILKMTEEERSRMNVIANSLLLLSDVLDNLVTDANSILGKYQVEKSTDFSKLKDVLKETRGLVSYFDNLLGDEKAQMIFGQVADDLYKMVFNKSKSFVTKLKKHEEKANKDSGRNERVA